MKKNQKSKFNIGDKVYFLGKAPEFNCWHATITKIDGEKIFGDCENKNIHKNEEMKNAELPVEHLKMRKGK